MADEYNNPTEFGIETVGPFKDHPSFITSGHRPNHPITKDSLDESIKSLLSRGMEDTNEINICLRSIDGFYSFPQDTKLSEIPGRELADVIDFDPVREVFIIRGEVKPDISSELMWFGFRVLEEYDYLCIMNIDGEWPMRIPELTDDRIELGLNVAKKWKEGESFRSDGYRFIRGKNLEGLLERIIETLDQKSQ